MLGVDILPSELPREASAHFGRLLLPFVSELATTEGDVTTADGLSPELAGACVTVNGKLSPKYRYISAMRTPGDGEDEVEGCNVGGTRSSSPHIDLKLVGHLFDSNLINAALDVVEAEGDAQ